MAETAIDDEHLNAWSKSRPSFVLFNRAFAPTPTIFDLPAEIRDRLNGVRPDLLVASNDQLDQIGIVLAHDQLAQFQKGVPVLIVAARVDQQEALKRGRRAKKDLERRVQDAHAVQTYVGMERLCEWMLAHGTVELTVEEQRLRVTKLFAEKVWLKDPSAKKAATDENRLGFFRTQFDAGSRLISAWYPWADTPDVLSRVARKIVKTSLATMKHSKIGETIDHELAMNRFMLRCLRQATTLVLAEHAMSDEIRKRGRETKHQQAVLAGAIPDRPALHEAVRAALDGDFNPSELFRSLLSYHDTLELARLIGRCGRGHNESLELTLVREMKRQIRLREECEDSATQAEGTLNGEHEAALVITQAAYELFSPKNWREELDKAIAAGESVTLTG
ncbi:MAG: hypothetical protein AB7V13_08270 [Pseudorhodoplanes sp.]